MMLFDMLYNELQMRYRKAERRGKVQIRGRIAMQGHGKFAFGRKVKIFSRWDVNPIGSGTGKTVLQTIGNGSISIGDGTGLSHVIIVSRSSVTVGSNVLLGGGVKIYDNDFHAIDYRDREKPDSVLSAPVIIEDNAFIGTDSLILKGVTVGKGSVIGAGSVVTKNVPPHQIWAGNPAKFIRELD